MAGNHCINCRFYVDHIQMGQCRFLPTFQNRHRNEWCGQFKPSGVCPEQSGTFLPVVGETSEKLDILKPDAAKKRGRPPKDKND
mgnify:CR=1 FL=1